MWILMAILGGCAPTDSLSLGVSPVLVCDEGEDELILLEGDALDPTVVDTLSGSPVLGWPSLRLDPATGPGVGSDPIGDRPITVPIGGDHATWLGPGQVELRIDAALGLSAGTWDVVAVQPDGRESGVGSALAVAGPPEITGIDPADLCHDGLAEIRVSGEGLLVVQGVPPTVTVGGLAAEVVDTEGCVSLAPPGDGELCETLVVSVDTSALAFGEATITVTNPDPAACASEGLASVQVSAPPEISGVFPDAVCRTGGEIEVSGDNFTADMVVSAGGEALETTFVDEHTLLATLPESAEPGVVDLTVSAPGGCSDTLPLGLTIAPEPVVFMLDPPSVWSGASVEVEAWISDVIGEITEVWLEDEAGARVEVSWTWDPATPGHVDLLVPAGLAAGPYQLQVVQDETCPGEASATLEVISQPTVSVDSVDPAYAWTWTWTPVTIRAADPLPSGELGYVSTPRVYLVDPDGASTRLLSVDMRSELEMSAIIPDELPVGLYDLLVVNPDGAIGVLEDGLSVTEQAPPEIRAVTPPSVPHSGTTVLSIQGKEFRDPTVTLTCEESGVETTLTPTITDWDYNEITATVAPSSIGQAVCVVSVLNSDGMSCRWSAISITNPAQNLFPWTAGSDLNTARRGPAAASGRTTSVDRYVYAIGGDDGDSSGALDSIEVASVGVYGDMGAWTVSAGTLPGPRSLAAAVTLDRFVYVIGGNDGSGPLTSVLRAIILDPLDVPRLEDVSVRSVEEGGLEPGDWTWRISALFPEDHEVNPGGESLPGDPITMSLPALDTGLVPTLSWTEVDGATGYRIYRSLAVDGAELGWVGDVTDPWFTDEGDPADAALQPLEEGALGAWATLAELSEARESPCAAWGRDPVTDPELLHLYVAGGLGEDGEALDSVEMLDITVVSDDVQRSGDWVDAGESLSKARYRCGGFTADSSLHPAVPSGESWVYFAGGETDSRTTGAVDAGRVIEGGGLEDWQTVDSMSPARSGFGYAAASNFLYAFGGTQGEASKSGVSGELTEGDLPEFDNWNSLGTSMSADRVLPGSAQESAVIFVIGGADDAGVALFSTDVTSF